MRLTFCPICLTALLFICTCFGCTHSNETITITRLDRQLNNGQFHDSISQAAARQLFSIIGIDKLNDSTITEFNNRPGIKIFREATDSLLPSLNETESRLGSIATKMNQLLPDCDIPLFFGVVLPYNQSIIRYDSLLYISLNHYLGENFDGYSRFEQYRRRSKRLDRLPFDIIESIITYTYPMKGDNLTALNAMLYFGALTEVQLQLQSGTTEQEVMDYTAEEMAWIDANESQAWNALATRGLLYDTSIATIDRLTQPAPATSILHNNAPKQLGRLIGHRIVLAYLKKYPETTIRQLLDPKFYADTNTLIKSGYSPL